MSYKVIDLFAGPGGLGEGFASLNGGKAFEIVVSAEMEESAHKTLTLRSYFRHAKRGQDRNALSAYYDFCHSSSAPHPKDVAPDLWAKATSEARQLTLGSQAGNEELDKIIAAAKLSSDKTVVIGGPPCQAYSLVGRARNLGKANYKAEDDHRHFLYKEYLRILQKVSPAVFVMENVKGILSSKVNNKLVFHDILRDLSNPSIATQSGDGPEYVIHSLVTDTAFSYGMDPESIDPRDFIIYSERYGIPQARHRVILLGIRKSELGGKSFARLSRADHTVTLEQALFNLPKLRSKLGRSDSASTWAKTVSDLSVRLAQEARDAGELQMATALSNLKSRFSDELGTGGLRIPHTQPAENSQNRYSEWVTDTQLDVWLNHETRSHMTSDLGRYLFASTFADTFERSPKGHTDFALPSLAPAHANWESGKFADRFKVQLYTRPSTTVTSHISKDGHYFIHPDPSQCRSLTVREAARLQTFPDNYFFQGNRTQQFHQVGNAVPSLLANQIATICNDLLASRKK
ncbi:DNA cytosine methyltransferase [Rhodoferax aquaticus]|uniref:DNA (cytosine-5-)-methyltransferase n=1 Tax=Rhodoferax aquaticus TaxID=2527691 RepID=A0A515EUU8_9BURK|nr:DNA cytosine methyltransferase [Rhodoferax aquaticus]QDL56408.1 DNA cytosine methyltransferase [Rhodoferax aquaticus]